MNSSENIQYENFDNLIVSGMKIVILTLRFNLKYVNTFQFEVLFSLSK